MQHVGRSATDRVQRIQLFDGLACEENLLGKGAASEGQPVIIFLEVVPSPLGRIVDGKRAREGRIIGVRLVQGLDRRITSREPRAEKSEGRLGSVTSPIARRLDVDGPEAQRRIVFVVADNLLDVLLVSTPHGRGVRFTVLPAGDLREGRIELDRVARGGFKAGVKKGVVNFLSQTTAP